MAGFGFNVPFGIDEDIACAAAGTWKGLVSVKAPANTDIFVTDIDAFFNGTSGDGEPIRLRLVRITADSGTATTVTKASTDNRLGGTAQSVGRKNFTALPTITADTILWGGLAHPQGGIMKDSEFKKRWVARGTEVCLLALVSSGTPPTRAVGQLTCEE